MTGWLHGRNRPRPIRRNMPGLTWRAGKRNTVARTFTLTFGRFLKSQANWNHDCGLRELGRSPKHLPASQTFDRSKKAEETNWPGAILSRPPTIKPISID